MESPDKLYAEAQNGRKLSAPERRRVIAYLDEIQEHYSNYQLAAVFGCDEKLIRLDRKRLMRAYANAITPENAMGFVADYIKTHDELIARSRKALDGLTEGGQSHRAYIALISELTQKRLKALQDIGVVERELGHLNVSEEKWVATVSKEGITSVGKDAGQIALNEEKP